MSTTVLSDADTAVPELVAAAAVGHGHTLQVEGRVFRGVVRPAGASPQPTDLATLAVLSGAYQDDPASQDGTQLLPDTHTAYHRQFTLERRTCAIATWQFTDEHPWWKNIYLPLLDIFTMGDPATDDGAVRRWLQLIAGFTGLAVLPIVVAAAMHATEAFRTAPAGHPPAQDLSDHIVLVGLGKIGTRVLARLRTTDHQVVVVERDPHARGVGLARELGVPLLLEDAAAPGILERARVQVSKSLLVLTRDDGENLDIAMAAREANPDIRVVMRLYDGDFAATVQRTLRASYPVHGRGRRRTPRAGGPFRPRGVPGTPVAGPGPRRVRRRVLRAGGRVVLATTRRGLDVLMSGVQPHPAG
ncbi:NAD(P)-binding protein [Streptomyces sp. NPDC086554]|uniref:potassium channel family protein n=1 Tax=Streptomyces sp. NPDC086554 TaxID=3154864 RepID=UPI003426C2AF